MKRPVVVFFTTLASQRAAQEFARSVVLGGYAACINVVGPVKSFYLWKNKFNKDAEFLLVGKTTSVQFKQLKKDIKALHPYEVPELISLKVADGHQPYLDWVFSSVGGVTRRIPRRR